MRGLLGGWHSKPPQLPILAPTTRKLPTFSTPEPWQNVCVCLLEALRAVHRAAVAGVGRTRPARTLSRCDSSAMMVRKSAARPSSFLACRGAHTRPQRAQQDAQAAWHAPDVRASRGAGGTHAHVPAVSCTPRWAPARGCTAAAYGAAQPSPPKLPHLTCHLVRHDQHTARAARIHGAQLGVHALQGPQRGARWGMLGSLPGAWAQAIQQRHTGQQSGQQSLWRVGHGSASGEGDGGARPCWQTPLTAPSVMTARLRGAGARSAGSHACTAAGGAAEGLLSGVTGAAASADQSSVGPSLACSRCGTRNGRHQVVDSCTPVCCRPGTRPTRQRPRRAVGAVRPCPLTGLLPHQLHCCGRDDQQGPVLGGKAGGDAQRLRHSRRSAGRRAGTGVPPPDAREGAC